jgi:two-component system sensor histidine kinase PhoQ
MPSIHLRLLLVATLVLGGFLGIAGWALETAFRDSSKTALQEKLQSYVYGLLAAADVDAQGKMRLPQTLPEPRFSQPDSGLYAFVTDAKGELFWRSPSTLGLQIPTSPSMSAGKTMLRRENGLFLFSHGLEWEDDSGGSQEFTFNIAEQARFLDQAVGSFRQTLWSWLIGLALVLLIVQAMVLRWGLRPLRDVEEDLESIRKGKSTHLQAEYPRELQGLTSSLNALIKQAGAAQERYRNSLDDLAHSLKTPLAYLDSVLQDQDASCEQLRAVTKEQLRRMDHIVQHQLQRAAVSARTTLMEPVAVASLVDRLLAALEKIYAEKQLKVSRSLSAEAVFVGDKADLMEVLGNLLENAFKYARSKVRVSATMNGGLELMIEDDGPGIPETQWKAVLRRGKRVDETQTGQGIGLAVANEIVALYEGLLEAGESELGGLKLRIRFSDTKTSAAAIGQEQR